MGLCQDMVVLTCIGLCTVVHGTIWSERIKQTDGNHVVQLSTLTDVHINSLARRKRDISTGDDSKLSVHNTTLKDKNHNEAIVHWSGKGSDVIFILTREHYPNGSVPSSKLYRSTNYGSTFSEIEIGKDALIRYYYSSPSNSKMLIFTDIVNKTIYLTEDEGETFTKIGPLDFSPAQLQFHPTDAKSVLAYDYNTNELRCSTDLGRSWDLVSSYVNPRFFWADGTYEDKNVIHLEAQDPDTGNYQYKICGKPFCTDMTFDKITSNNIDVNSLVIINEYIFIQKSTEFSSTLYVSSNRKPFQPAYFPIDAHPLDFNIVNADEHQVFIAADTAEKKVNLYLSDTTGQFYIESLQDLVVLRSYSGGFDADLYEVRGMTGVFIANTKHPTEGAKSRITFDQGGEWQYLTAPDKHASGGPSNCKLPDCSLHLHITFSMRYGIFPPLSEEEAPGIIMAHGNIGSGLSTANITMFMSNDTGVTWRAVFEGINLYNILDQGGAMVAVPQDRNSQGTNVIKYSYTEGESWEQYTFTSPTLQVDGVLNEPGITTRIVSIYGHLSKDAAWVVLKVNFSSILTRKCDDSDYYDWTTLEKLAKERCVLGQRLTFKRRKQTAKCYNGENYEHANKTILCDCHEEDYECDYGYRAGDDKHTCVAHKWFNPERPSFECPEGTTYQKSQGHRKIAADKCQGAALEKKYAPVSTKCPRTKPQELSISTGESRTAGTGQLITIQLIQKRGSKKSTVYTWNFGDKSPIVTITSFDKAKLQKHTFKSKGMFTITVNASNSEGYTLATSYLHVEDVIKGVYVDEPHGAKAKYPVQFEAWPLSKTWRASSSADVHYTWTFGDEGKVRPLLTYSRTVNHTFYKPGNYSVIVQAVNSVGSVFKKFTLTVYGTLKTVQLSFSPGIERLNKNTELWRKQFADILLDIISEEIQVMKHRLEVVMLSGRPTKADVSILPVEQTSTEDTSIDVILKRILENVNDKGLVVQIGNEDFGEGKINITKAVVLNDDIPHDNKKHPRNLVAVFVCVPILMVGIFVSFLVVLYYRKKFSHVRRYAMLQQSDAEDRLLGEDDDDDEDVPPLDLNPDRGRGGRLAMEDDDDDDRSDLFQPG